MTCLCACLEADDKTYKLGGGVVRRMRLHQNDVELEQK